MIIKLDNAYENCKSLKMCNVPRNIAFLKSYNTYNNKTSILLPKSFPLKSFKYFKILDTQILKGQFYFVKVLKIVILA